MIGADVHRVPLRRLAGAEQDQVLGQPERGVGRKHIGAARQIFLDDVVLGRALKLAARRALFVGDRDIERHQPGRGRVDGHRGVHRRERNPVEQRAHVADMGDRDADLADLAAGERMVAVETGLGRQVEGDREAGLSLGQVLAIEPVGLARGRMAGVGAEDPGLVAARRRLFVRPPAPCSSALGRAPPATPPAPKFCAGHNYRKISATPQPRPAVAAEWGAEFSESALRDRARGQNRRQQAADNQR